MRSSSVAGGIETARRLKPLLPPSALTLLLAAWGSSILGQHRASQLDLSRFIPCADVYDALKKDGYVAKFQLPYFEVALFLDGLAVIMLVAAFVTGRFRVLSLLVALASVPTIAWHGLAWFVLSVFASGA